MEKTLVILKPCTIQRGLMGKIISRLERKGLFAVGIKMEWLDEETIREHYKHLLDKPFFPSISESMRACPVLLMCWEGKEAVKVVHSLVGSTNGRDALPGTIRGDYSISTQENIIHASDSLENARTEIDRFFKKEELFDYPLQLRKSIYGSDER